MSGMQFNLFSYAMQHKSATQEKFNAYATAWLMKIIFITFFISFFFSCSNNQHSDKQVFYYNETTGVATLDPAFARNQSIMSGCASIV
jgi:hypothetical protein